MSGGKRPKNQKSYAITREGVKPSFKSNLNDFVDDEEENEE